LPETGKNQMKRLKVNLIVGGKFYPRGDIIAEEIVPLKFRGEEYCADVEDQETGMVMLLRPLSFMTPQTHEPGRVANFQQTLAADTLIAWDDIPERVRVRLEEGVHFVWQWNEAERKARMSSNYEDEENQWDKMSKIHTQDLGFGKGLPRYEEP
jgi:hypothetical protein